MTIKKKKYKNPEVGLEYLQNLIGKKVVLLVNNGYVEAILEYNKSKYRLIHPQGIFSFTFLEKDVKKLDFEPGGNYYIDIRTNL